MKTEERITVRFQSNNMPRRTLKGDQSWSSYTCALYDERKYKGMIQCAGTLEHRLQTQDQELELIGKWNSYRGNIQFKFFSYLEKLAVGERAIVKFLITAPHIGEGRAKKLFKKYGAEILDVLERGETLELEGFQHRMSKEASEFLSNRVRSVRNRLAFDELLSGLGFPKLLAENLSSTKGASYISVIKKNPFVLMDEPGCGFLRCDQLRSRLCLPIDMPERLKSAVKYYFEKQSTQIWIPWTKLYTGIQQLIGNSTDISELVNGMLAANSDGCTLHGELCFWNSRFGPCYALAVHAQDEAQIANRIKTMACTPFSWPTIDDEKISLHQQEQYNLSTNGRISVLMGSAGTGKTTVASSIVREFHKQGMKILGCALSGKAAQRLEEGFNHNNIPISCTTAHRMLGAKPDNKLGFEFEYGKDNQLSAGLVVIDEVGMLPNWLLLKILQAIPDNCAVLILGDPFQLPPIERGAFLRDWQTICKNKKGDWVDLRFGLMTEPRRTIGGITMLATMIRDGIVPTEDKFAELDNVHLRRHISQETAAADVVKVCEYLYNHGIDIFDTQVIVANRSGIPLSVDELNITLRNMYFPDSSKQRRKFVKGEKALCTKNFFTKNGGVFVSNGTICRVNEYIGEQAELESVKMQGDNLFLVTFEELNQNFIHGYASTCHKMQGDQANHVIFAGLQHAKFNCVASRALLYTSFTRPIQTLTIISNRETIAWACNKGDIEKRITAFTEYFNDSKEASENVQS